jgi:myo-inositol-1(or 4)-monophosphatase
VNDSKQTADFLQLALFAAGEAGRFLQAEQHTFDPSAVESKTEHDFVSYVDRQAERRITGLIRAAFPGHAILAEESGSQGAGAYTWVIDPLDGTSNFIHGLPHYAVSIALYHNGLPLVGVVHHPVAAETFQAVRGQGSALNGRAIHVGTRRDLQDALAVTAFPFRDRTTLDVALQRFQAIFSRIHDVRRSGSAALDLAYVASGRYDCYFEGRLAPWDYAAGRLLVEEAGGIAGDYSGQPLALDHTAVLAANPAIYAQLLPLLCPPRA